jgi:hypothetical protein
MAFRLGQNLCQNGNRRRYAGVSYAGGRSQLNKSNRVRVNMGNLENVML